MKDLIIKTAPLAPSKGIHPQEVIDQFNWRKTGIYTGKSFIGLCADIDEQIWWNRPLDSDVLCKQEPDGIYSYNFPYLYKKEDFKTGYNILVNKNSIPVISQIKINPNWTKDQLKLLDKFMLKTVYKTLIDLGVNSNEIILTRNDLLFNGKKFMGTEEIIRDGYYSMDCVITLKYLPEKEIFANLTGKYALARGITGILEETSLFTKEQFVTKLIENLKEYFEQID